MFYSYVAVGDSFTEGVGDEQPDGSVRGWADLVALGLARASSEPVRYANLAIRGRKLGPIIDEQLPHALDLGAELLSFNGGGNDILRPKVSIENVVSLTLDAVHRVQDAGTHVLLLSGGNPCAHLPAGRTMRRRGDAFNAAIQERLTGGGVTFVDNWSDRILEDARYWSADRLHLNARGHTRVASNVLAALGVPIPEEWRPQDPEHDAVAPETHTSLAYYRTYVLPWIGRRLTGRSSGDGRSAKRPELVPIDVDTASGKADADER